MAVLMLALGSRGDVEPMAVVGGALARAGGDVAVVALSEYAGLVEDLGARCLPIAASLKEITSESRTVLGRIAYSTPLGQAMLLKRWGRTMASEVADVVAQTLCEGDTLVTGLLGDGVIRDLSAAGWTRSATVLFTGQLPTAHAHSHYFGTSFSPNPAWNRVQGEWSLRFAASLGEPIAEAVRSSLGVPKSPVHATGHKYLLAASPVVVPPAPDWPVGTIQTGYPVTPVDPVFGPPAIVVDFLAGGSAPVYVGFGSMSGVARPDLRQTLVQVAATTGQRIVTIASGLDASSRWGPDVLAVGPIPHSWLFPKMAAVIHHGGAGTTHAGLAAGVPSVAVPFGVDQPYHGRRLHSLGVGPKPLPVRRLSAGTLSRLIGEITCGPVASTYRSRAREVSRLMQAEKGVETAVSVILALEDA